MSEAVPLKRERNMPKAEILRPQGDSRYLARVHPNVEYKTASGLVVANTEQTQDVPTTGDVISLSPLFDHAKYPDVKPGMCIKVVRNGWSTFQVDGEWYAVGTAAQVLACYDPADLEAVTE